MKADFFSQKKGFASLAVTASGLGLAVVIGLVVLFLRPAPKSRTPQAETETLPTPTVTAPQTSGTEAWQKYEVQTYITDIQTYENRDVFFSIQYPKDWDLQNRADTGGGVFLKGSQGEIHLNWGSGIGRPACPDKDLQKVQSKSVSFNLCRVLRSDGSERFGNYDGPVVEGSRQTFVIQATAYAPSEANRDIILKILSTLEFK